MSTIESPYQRIIAAFGQCAVLSVRLLVPLALIFGTFAHAQFEDGSLVGTVHDATGAVIRGLR